MGNNVRGGPHLERGSDGVPSMYMRGSLRKKEIGGHAYLEKATLVVGCVSRLPAMIRLEKSSKIFPGLDLRLSTGLCAPEL